MTVFGLTSAIGAAVSKEGGQALQSHINALKEVALSDADSSGSAGYTEVTPAELIGMGLING